MATPLDEELRLRIEAALPPEVLLTLRWYMRLLGESPDDWPHASPARLFFETFAALLRASELSRDEGLNDTPALERAAVAFGLNPETLLSNRKNWRKKVRDARREIRAKSHPENPTPAGSLEENGKAA